MIAAAFLAVVAGCGGASKTYVFAPFRACVEGSATATFSASDGDYIALDAPGGGGGVRFAHNFVSVGFQRTENDASQVAGEGKAFGGDSAKVYNIGNVYISWDYTPSDAEKQVLDACIS